MCMNRVLRVTGLLVSALSLGMWISASWHASTAGLPGQGACCGPVGKIMQHCACAHPKLTVPSAVVQVCAVCLAGAVTQDTPGYVSLATPPREVPAVAPLSFVVLACDQVARPLPPQTGPPTASF